MVARAVLSVAVNATVLRNVLLYPAPPGVLQIRTAPVVMFVSMETVSPLQIRVRLATMMMTVVAQTVV